MRTARHLPRNTWADYLGDLAEERRGAPVRLTIDWASLGEEVEAREMLLESLSYDAHDDAIEIAAVQPSVTGPAVLRHVIAHPQLVEVDSPAGILARRLTIDGQDGARTIITITPEPELSG